jgi:hypothetical protein
MDVPVQGVSLSKPKSQNAESLQNSETPVGDFESLRQVICAVIVFQRSEKFSLTAYRLIFASDRPARFVNH